MAVLLTGKPVADALSADTRTRAEALLSKGVQPRLVLLRCGDNEADGAYIRGAVKRAALCGVAAELRTLPADASADVVAAAIDAVNRDPAVHGCLLLRPLPPHLRGEESALCARLAPDKDVDGMTPESAAAVFTGQGRGFAPCTAQACMALLHHYGIAPCGRHAVVIGRSPVVGRPVSMLLLRENATVTVCHTRTPDTAALSGYHHHRRRRGQQPDRRPCPTRPDRVGCVHELERYRPLRRRGLSGGVVHRGCHHACARRRRGCHLRGADGPYRPRGGISDRGGRRMNVFTPAETAANYAAAGVLKTRQPFLKLLLLGIAAGALIGFPVCVTNMATYAITNASAVRIIAGVLFAFGLGIVVLTGAELFTGNTLLVISLLDRRVTWCAMLRNWGVVYLGNFLGALTLSWICARFGWLDAGDGALGAYTMQLAVGKMTMPFGKAFFMGVLCNILVTVAVLASLSAKDAAGRILGAWAPVMFFVVAGFSHSIADMTYCALALFGKSAPACAAAAQAAGADLSVLTWSRYFLGNMLPVTLGNTAGGVLVGLAAWYCYLRKKG